MTADLAPPEFLRLAGHPLRWSLLAALTDGDRQVRELTGLTGEPQNLVSYHLARLRSAGLVHTRRSSADRRDSYYSLDLARCGELLSVTGSELHPGLRLAPPSPPPTIPAGTRVLFLCTGNSSRSQMAEALLRHASDGTITVASAGSHPKPLHPGAVRVMAARGIDVSSQQPKHLDTYAGERFAYVITLCDKVREVCPEFGGGGRTAHWSLADPAEDGTDAAFEACAGELGRRVGFLVHRLASPAAPPPR